MEHVTISIMACQPDYSASMQAASFRTMICLNGNSVMTRARMTLPVSPDRVRVKAQNGVIMAIFALSLLMLFTTLFVSIQHYPAHPGPRPVFRATVSPQSTHRRR